MDHQHGGELSARENADGSMTITACGAETWALSQAPVRYSAKTIFRNELRGPGIVTVTWDVPPESQAKAPVKIDPLPVRHDAQVGFGGGGGGGAPVFVKSEMKGVQLCWDDSQGGERVCRLAIEDGAAPLSGLLSPAETRRMREYHAALLGRPVEQLERDRIGEGRWTRRDLVAVDAVLAKRARRASVKRAAVWLAVGLACGVVGQVAAFLLTAR